MGREIDSRQAIGICFLIEKNVFHRDFSRDVLLAALSVFINEPTLDWQDLVRKPFDLLKRPPEFWSGVSRVTR
jgi:hypothetical protein